MPHPHAAILKSSETCAGQDGVLYSSGGRNVNVFIYIHISYYCTWIGKKIFLWKI